MSSLRIFALVCSLVSGASAFAQFPVLDSLTENNSVTWGVAADTGPASISIDAQRFHEGSGAIHIQAPSLYFVHAWVPKQRNAGWDLREVSFIRFWAYIETSRWAFLPHSPRVRLGTTENDYIEIEIQTNFYPNDPPPHQWHEFLIPLSGATAWKRTVVGSPDLSRINYFEIFTNTWDLGFDLWLDGLGFLELSELAFERERLELFETWRFTPTAIGMTAAGVVDVPASTITGWKSSMPTVASVDSDGQVTTHSAGLATISAVALGRVIEQPVEVIRAKIPPRIESIPPELAEPAADYLWEMPVVIIRYLPTADGVNLDTSVSPGFFGLDEISLKELIGIIDQYDLRMKFMLEEGSRFRGYKNPMARPSLGYRVVKYITVYEPLPPGKLARLDMGHPVYIPDYAGLFKRFELENLINSEGIREIWLWNSSFDSLFPSYDPLIHDSLNAREVWESNMSSPTTGDISNSNRDNTDLPVYEHTYVLYGASIRRTQAEGIHNHGHQLESILSYAGWLQDGNSELFWHEFVGQDEENNFVTGRCGWTHMPPNTVGNYDYENPAVELSDCEDWRPGGGLLKATSISTWRDIDYPWPDTGFIPQKTESQWYIYWMQNMPGFNNQISGQEISRTLAHDDDQMTNWWRLTARWDDVAIGAGLHGTAPFQLNAGFNDAWYSPLTDGQGFFITVFPETGVVMLAWFTYDTDLPSVNAVADLGDPGHRWLTAQGVLDGNQSVLEISMTSGGIFDREAEVSRVNDGTIVLSFGDCLNGKVEYDIPSIGKRGLVKIQRITNDNVPLCEELISSASTRAMADQPDAIQATADFEMNSGLNDAWFNPATDGQGFFITIFPGIDTVFLAWFTYDTSLPGSGDVANLGDPGHRWLTAQGIYKGNRSVMDITITSGGLFDTPSEVQRTDPPGSDGTMTLNFDSCSSGTIDYDIPSANLTGTVPIQRIVNDNVAICEKLSP